MNSNFTKSLLFIGLITPEIVSAMDLDISILLDAQVATNTNNIDIQSARVSVTPEVRAYFANGFKLTAIGRLFSDAIDGIQPDDIDRDSYSPFSSSALLSNSVELEFREFFLETSIGDDYLTIGKQQVVWGKADGLKVLDVVNPQSFRDFILEDFEESRIPLWSVNYEWQVNDDSTLQFLWIPDQTVSALPESGATYAFTTPRFVPSAPPGIAVEISPINRPSKIISDSDIGLRWSAFLGGWDLTLNYLYHYDDLPVFFRRLNVTQTGTKVFIDPEYKRSHLLGGTFSNAFGDLTIRGELGYSSGKYFLTNDAIDLDGVVESDEFSYVLGFDWFGFSETLLSVQLFQSAVLESPTGMTRPDVDTTLSFLAEKEFLNDTLKAEVLILQNLNDGDGLVRPKITYEWKDDLKTWVGVDYFYGDKQGLFGQFNDNDRVIFGIEIGF